MKNYSVSEFLARLKTLNHEQLDSIKGIGPVLAENIIEFVKSQRFQTLSNDFKDLEKSKLAPHVTVPEENTNSIFNTKTFVITGSFDISRDVIKEKLEQLGATVSGSISKNTDYLLAGEKAGSKLEKAQSLGVSVINSLEELGI